MIYSFSRLSLYEQCPYRFRLKYIEGRQEPVTKPLALGKGVHKGIEGRINKKLTVEEAASLALIEADFHPEVTYDEVAKLISNAPVDELDGETEVHFELPLSDSPSAPRIQGYIDLVRKDEFIDWKTHWKAYDVWDNMQIPIYAWAFMHLKDVSSVRGMLYFLRFKRKFSYTFSKNDAEKARIWAYDLASEIDEKLFLAQVDPSKIDDLFPATPSSHCSHCPFAVECYEKFGRL